MDSFQLEWKSFNGSLPVRVLKVHPCKLKKPMINDHLPIWKVSSKVSFKIFIPTIYNFAVIYLWNLLFLQKSSLLFLTLSFLTLSFLFINKTLRLKNLNSHECENFIVCYLCWRDHILLLYNVPDIYLKIIFLCDAQLQQVSKLIRKPFWNFLTKITVNL